MDWSTVLPSITYRLVSWHCSCYVHLPSRHPRMLRNVGYYPQLCCQTFTCVLMGLTPRSNGFSWIVSLNSKWFGNCRVVFCFVYVLREPHVVSCLFFCLRFCFVGWLAVIPSAAELLLSPVIVKFSNTVGFRRFICSIIVIRALLLMWGYLLNQ